MTVEVGVIMGSKSDWETMRYACKALTKFDVQFEKRIVSDHRTPQLMAKYANQAAKKTLGLSLLEPEDLYICQE